MVYTPQIYNWKIGNTTEYIYIPQINMLSLYHPLDRLISQQINICLIFLQKIDFEETVCMKCQRLLSGKNEKKIAKCHLLKFLPRVLSTNPLIPDVPQSGL